MYHVPSLKKLIREPKADYSRLIAVRRDDQVYFSNGRWMIAVDPDGLQASLQGFIPTTDEPKGCGWTSEAGRIPGAPDVNAVIPDAGVGDPITVTQWEYLQNNDIIPAARMFIRDDGKTVFIDRLFWDPIQVIYRDAGPLTLTTGDYGSPICARDADGKFVFLVMPLRIDETPAFPR